MRMSQEIIQRAANNFTDYKVIINPSYTRTAHLDLLDKALMEVARYLETGEGIQNLIIEMPPRSGKSLSTSELFPGWVLGRRPDTRIILASYGAALSEMASRRARDYVNSDLYRTIFPGTKPNENLQRAGEWDVIGDGGKTGGMVAVGVGGAVVGKGMDLFIFDDMHKNRIEAENKNTRDTTWGSYTNDFLSRFNNAHRAAQIIMAQRYHTDDVIGRILASPTAHLWRRLRLPALAEKNDILGREIGEPLWPDRMSKKWLLELADRDPYSFASQYQQNPVPRGETLFEADKIEVIPSAPPVLHVVRFWDLAVSTGKRNDFTVGLKLGITQDEEPIVMDVWRGKVTAPEMLDIIASVASRDGTGVPIVLEGEKAGIVQFDYLLNDARLRGYQLEKRAPKGDKATRAAGIATRVKYGKVKAVMGAYLTDFLNEVAMFPFAAHDDQVDALSGGYQFLTENNEVTFDVNSVGQDRFGQ